MAGGGKTRCCLTKYLPELADPHTKIIILRKTIPALKLPGGIVDESKKIYPYFGGVYKKQDMRWDFPSGATISFKGLPDDITEYQGLQATHILIDEVADWKEDDVLFLLGRMRSGEYKGHFQAQWSCNPDNSSFLFEWVKPFLDEDGIPRAGTENIVRWFVNLSGKIIWADSKEEIIKYCPDGLVVGEDFIPLSFRFVPLTIEDNPILLKNNPGYKAALLAQPRVNQLRYLHGSWTAKPEGHGHFKREWVEIVDAPPTAVTGRVRSWDLAASEVSETNRNPDYTAGVKVSRDKMGYFYIEDVYKFRKRSGEVVEEIIQTAFDDGLDECEVTVPRDAGAGGKSWASHLLSTLAEHGVIASTITMSGHSGKLQRFLPFAQLASAGKVRLVRGDWNEEYLKELENFTGLRSKGALHDDACDATSDAIKKLSRQLVLPSFSLPDMSKMSIISSIRN